MNTDTHYQEGQPSQILDTHKWGHRLAWTHVRPIITRLSRRNEYLAKRVQSLPDRGEKTERDRQLEEDYWEEQHHSYSDHRYSHN